MSAQRDARAGFAARRLLCALACAALAAGCGTAKDILDGPKVDYKSAGSLPPLEVPPDLTSPSRDDRYVVPETGRQAATLSVYQADRASRAAAGRGDVLPQVENMRVERAGSQRWLVVQEKPQKLWELVKDFWQENGFLIKNENPEAGIMETDWAENRAKIPEGGIRGALGKLLDQLYSTAERDKFRTRLERSADGQGTEVYISHRGMIEVYSGATSNTTDGSNTTVWQPRDPDPGLEAEFLRRLMVRLGAQEEKAKVLAAAAPAAPRASIKKGLDGAELLEVNDAFDRAWRRVGLALDRVGFTVEDRDRAKGIYYVRYADPEAEMDRKTKEKPGLLGNLAFWRSDDKQKVKAQQYRVAIKQNDDNSEVRILNKDGAAEASGTVRRILSLLHDQLK